MADDIKIPREILESFLTSGVISCSHVVCMENCAACYIRNKVDHPEKASEATPLPPAGDVGELVAALRSPCGIGAPSDHRVMLQAAAHLTRLAGENERLQRNFCITNREYQWQIDHSHELQKEANSLRTQLSEARAQLGKVMEGPAAEEGWKLVPLKPTADMWGELARDIVMWARMGSLATERELLRHLKSIGREIPQWLSNEIRDVDRVPPKGTVSAIIWKAMWYAVPTKPRATALPSPVLDKETVEACAKVAESFYDNSGLITLHLLPPLQKKIAKAIRALAPEVS